MRKAVAALPSPFRGRGLQGRQLLNRTQMKPTEKTILKFHDHKRKLKIKLCYSPETKTYLVYQNQFKNQFKKLSAAIYAFEDLVFQGFNNRLMLAEFEYKERTEK